MDRDLFYNWLKGFKKLDVTTSNARTSNCLRIEKFYGDLDKLYISDKFVSLIEQLAYTTIDKKLGSKQKHNIPIDGDIYNGTATLKAALKLYIEFKVNRKTLGITKSIRQVDEFLQSNTKWRNKLVESHPEFCFSKLNCNKPIMENKLTEEGQQKRLDILERYYPDSRRVVEKYLSDVPYRKKIDDVIDALCLAVTGKLIIELGLKTIPENPMMDARGILMQMAYGRVKHI